MAQNIESKYYQNQTHLMSKGEPKIITEASVSLSWYQILWHTPCVHHLSFNAFFKKSSLKKKVTFSKPKILEMVAGDVSFHWFPKHTSPWCVSPFNEWRVRILLAPTAKGWCAVGFCRAWLLSNHWLWLFSKSQSTWLWRLGWIKSKPWRTAESVCIY